MLVCVKTNQMPTIWFPFHPTTWTASMCWEQEFSSKIRTNTIFILLGKTFLFTTRNQNTLSNLRKTKMKRGFNIMKIKLIKIIRWHHLIQTNRSRLCKFNSKKCCAFFFFSTVTCSALPVICRRSVISSKPQSQRLLLDSPQLPAGCSEAVRVAVAGVVRAPMSPPASSVFISLSSWVWNRCRCSTDLSIKRSTIEIWCAPLWLRDFNRWRGRRKKVSGGTKEVFRRNKLFRTAALSGKKS